MTTIESEGTRAFSMRKIAKSLGVSPGALYPYVGSKEKLTEALIDSLFQQVDTKIFEADGWLDAIRAMALQLRSIFLRHGDIAKLTFGRIPMGPNFASVLELMIASVTKEGLPPQLAFYIGDLIGLYVAAAAYEDYLRSDMNEDTPRIQDSVDAFRQFLNSLSPLQYPNIQLAMSKPWNSNLDRFELGLDVLLTGMQRTFSELQLDESSQT